MPLENLLPVPSSPDHVPRDLFASPDVSPIEPKEAGEWDDTILTAISNVTLRYKTLAKLGEGASADVFRAHDTRIGREVALKRYNEEAFESAPEESDYLSELAAVSKVCHPNVVRAYDVDDDEDGPFITFELIEGMNLEDKLKEGPLPTEQVRHFLVQALEALIAVHDKELSHLDIKPANFMVTPSEHGIPHYTLIDFGRACDASREQQRRENKDQGLRGSIHYMAPEQFANCQQDHRTDLYALGAVTYELLTGEKAFEGENSVQIMSAHLTNRTTPISERCPDLPFGMAVWVTSLISKNPDARPQSAKDALRCLLSISGLQFSSPEAEEAKPMSKSA